MIITTFINITIVIQEKPAERSEPTRRPGKAKRRKQNLPFFLSIGTHTVRLKNHLRLSPSAFSPSMKQLQRQRHLVPRKNRDDQTWIILSGTLRRISRGCPILFLLQLLPVPASVVLYSRSPMSRNNGRSLEIGCVGHSLGCLGMPLRDHLRRQSLSK